MLSARSWLIISGLYLSLICSVGLMGALSWSEFQFNHRFHTEKLPADYPVRSYYPDIASMTRYAKKLSTNDQLWKYMSGDSRFYVAQVRDPKGAIAPYRYRIVPIYLVRAIMQVTGKSVNTSFVSLNVFAVLAAALMFTRYLLLLEFTPALSVVGALCFLTMPACAGTIAYPLLEAMSFFFVAAIFLAALEGSLVLFTVAAILGVLTKEVLVFSGLLWFVTNWRRKEHPLWLHALIAAMPLVAFVVVRLVLGHGAIEVNYGFDLLHGQLPTKYLEKRLTVSKFANFVVAVGYAFSFMWLGVLYLKAAPKFLRRSFFIVPLVIAATALLSGQVTRVLGVIFPVVIPLFLVLLRSERVLDGLARDARNSSS